MATNDNTRTGEIIEHYRLMSVLGTGSTSVVYLGQRLDNPQVTTAIKVLTFHATLGLGEQMAFRARFLREARAVSRLHHEHILPVLGYGEVDELTYMVLPLVASGTLAARLAQAQAAQTQLSLTHVADILNQLASALDYAHAQGIVHRDVKPSNVLVGDHAQLYLTDFGIARLVESGSNGLTIDQGGALTAAGQVLGTTYYMAPEQIRGEKVGPAADIYALGIVAFQLATGQLPYQGDTPLAVALQHLQENPATRPSLLRPDLPPSVEHAILRALAKRPADRFPSAGMFAQAFEQSLPTVHPATRQGPIAAPGDGASDSRTAWPLDEPGSLPPGRQSTDVTDTTAAGAQAAGATGGESADLGIERMARSARWYQPLVGTTLGSYRLDQLQAVSDIGALFRARGLADGAAYRVRVLSMPADLSAQARGALLARFQQTAHAVSELQHPYILPLVDYGSTPRWLYVVSPQVAGPTLGEQIAQTGSMTLRVVERYLGQLAAALEYAHDQGVLHTNLRVDCIYLSDTPTSARGSVLVAEFETRRMGELAREPDRFVSDREPDRKDRSLASTAAAPLYLDTEACAPEQLMGKPAVTATDVYALGVVLYAMLTGQSLYGGSMRDDVAQQHLYAPIPPLRALRAELPSELEPILARALAKDPRQRYQHPSELFAALRQVIQSAQVVEEEPPAALPPTVAAWGAVPSPQEKLVQPLLSNPAAPPAAVNQQSDVYAPQYGTPFAGNIAPPPALSPTRRSWAAPKPTLLGIMSGGGLLVLCVGMLLFSVGILGINPFAHATASSAHQPTATPVPSANPQPTATPQPLYSASLIDPADGWAGGDHCFFWSDGYHVKYLEGDPIHGGWHCESPVGSVADGYVSVQVKQLGGVTNYPYGILFREADGDNYYGFLIDSEGKWGAQKWVQGGETVLVKGTKNAIIHQGLYATNTLAVSFQGSHLEFYINGADVGGVDDTYFSLGNIALGAEQGQDVVFTNFQFAQL